MEMRWRFILVYLLLVVSYVVATFTAPVKGNTFSLNRFTLGLVQLSFVLPIILIWLAGLYGSSNLKQYVLTLKKAGEQAALRTVANGIIVLVSGLIVGSLLGSVRSYALGTDGYEAYRITYNYVTVLIPLVGMYLVYRGSRRLAEAVGVGPVDKKRQVIAGLILAAACVCVLTALFGNPYRSSTPDPIRFNSYYLTDPLIVGTVLLPQFLSWFFGIYAGLNIARYSAHLRHQEQSSGFRRIAFGIHCIVLVSYLIVMLTMLTAVVGKLSLAPILLLVYILLLFYGLGYVLIARGAKRLVRHNAPKRFV